MCCLMLKSKPLCTLQEKRISCVNALFHPFLEDGKMRYHTYLCSCCHTSASGRNFARDLEPSASFKFDSSYEKELTSIAKARGLLITLDGHFTENIGELLHHTIYH